MNVKVIKAIYASNWRGIDVTNIVKQHAEDGAYDFHAGNNMFPDPDPGNPKFFGTTFEFNGQLWAVACAEGEEIGLLPDNYRQLISQPQLTPGPQQPTVSLGIYSCVYGGNDVSAICQAIINVGAQKIHVNSQVMGMDPWNGYPKYLIAQVGNGYYGGKENDTINLS